MQTINLSNISVNDGDWILDVGCGEGRHTIGAHWQFPNAHCIGVDISLSDLAIAKSRLLEWRKQQASSNENEKKAHFLCASGFNLPFKDNSFDHLVCSEVLEHIPSYEEFFQECIRVLKPTGNLCISVPRAWPEKFCWMLSDAYHQIEGGHVHIFSKKQVIDLAKRYQYNCRLEHGAHALHVPYWWLRCAFWKHGEEHFVVKTYHKFLVWDLMKQPALTRWIDKLLNPFMGKSVVYYFTRGEK